MARTVRRPSTRHTEEEVSRAGEAAAEAVVMALLTDPAHPSMHTAVIPWVFYYRVLLVIFNVKV